MPTWDLSDMYPGHESPELKADLKKAADQAEAFAKTYKDKLAGLNSEEFASAMASYENIDEILSRVMSYAQLLHALNTDDPKIGQFYQSMAEHVTDISSHLLFFTLEINRIDDKVMAKLMKDPAAARYQPWVSEVRLYRDHQLSDEMERLLHEKHVAGRAAWIRLFDETMARLRFPLDGEELTESEVLNLLSDPNREKRQKAAETFAGVLKQQAPMFGLITNTLAKEKAIEDKWRKYPKPISRRNLSNMVEDNVVEALVEAVREAYPKLSHRYYALKAKWLGLDRLEYWDRNAPLPEADNSKIRYEQAQEMVLSAYGAFSDDLAAVGRKFFDQPWIDAPVKPGKTSGAFAHPTVPSAHPYLLLNYQGKTRDVMTMAHELGHGVHQLLAGEAQGHLLSDTPLTLAETASVFGEMLTFQAMLKQATDPTQRKVMLAEKVEDMLNTVVRQIAFHCYEDALHARRQQGELTVDEISEIWMETQTEALGPGVNLENEDYRLFWAYIPHFLHTPFYVYAYAFGDCLVNSLYAVYQENQADDFAVKYLDMLKAGGTKRHKKLLAPFALDASDPVFWQRGLSVISGLIDELETLG